MSKTVSTINSIGPQVSRSTKFGVCHVPERGLDAAELAKQTGQLATTDGRGSYMLGLATTEALEAQNKVSKRYPVV